MCTTIIVGKDASKDGSVIVAHTDDDVGDERVIRVPSFNYTERKVFYDDAALGPILSPSNKLYNSTAIRRYIGTDRGKGYETESEGYPDSISLGTIPCSGQDTYSYYDSNYGIINEKGLMFGECTCGAKIQPDPVQKQSIFYSSELSRVALERCTTAKEAIELIGQLINDHGYYGTGETLLIGDADEGWVLEMCAYRADGLKGIWVAQRVPDDEFFVAANQFRIRDIYRNDNDNNTLYKYSKDENGNTRDDLIYSSNLFTACNEAKWVNADVNLIDWAATVSYGEYMHPYYSLRRVWRAFSKASPLSNLPSKVEDGYTRAYPFSLKPDRKLSVLDVAEIYRDHYEGTDYDMTTGPAAGPFRNPVRYENNPDQGDSFNLNVYKASGAWERPISIYRCGTFWINQAKKVNGNTEAVSWISPERPVANCLMPFYCKMDKLPEKMETMNVLDFQFNGNSAWWAFNFVASLANQNYEYMMREIKALQSDFEKKAEEFVNERISSGNMDGFSQQCVDHCEDVIKEWWNLAIKLIVKYNDGCLSTGPNSIMEKIDYPKTWLRDVGYQNGPIEY